MPNQIARQKATHARIRTTLATQSIDSQRAMLSAYPVIDCHNRAAEPAPSNRKKC
jgi:hypothetical protein